MRNDDQTDQTEISPLRIETVSRVLSRTVLMPRGGKTTATRSSSVTLARVRFAEQPT